MQRKKLETLKDLLKQFFFEEAKGQGVKELNLEEYTCMELLDAIEEKLHS